MQRRTKILTAGVAAALAGLARVNQAQANVDAARAAVANSQAVVQQALEISTVQYRGGLTNYLQVITAQTSLLQNQRAAVDILTRRLVASVSLIQALGGSWDRSQLPSS